MHIVTQLIRSTMLGMALHYHTCFSKLHIQHRSKN